MECAQDIIIDQQIRDIALESTMSFPRTSQMADNLTLFFKMLQEWSLLERRICVAAGRYGT